MGADLSALLGTPSGISHGKFNEADASAMRLGFYLEGDNVSFHPELFKQLQQQALAKSNRTYSVDAIKGHLKNRYIASKVANKRFCFNLSSAGVVKGAYYFITGFFSSCTINAGSIANEASITSFYGAKANKASAWNDTGFEYTHVPEHIPEHSQYQRATPMAIPDPVVGILDVFLHTLPPIGGSGANLSWNVGPAHIPNNSQA